MILWPLRAPPFSDLMIEQNYVVSMSAQSRLQIIFLVAASISLGFICTDIYIPSMTNLPSIMRVHDDAIQMTVASNLIGAVFSGIFAGTLSDTLGRRPLMLSGLIIFVLGSFLAAWSHDLTSLIVGRFVQGWGVGIFNVIGTATIQDLFNERESAKAMARMEVGFTLVPSLAPIIGAYVHMTLGWRVNFYIVAFTAFTILILSFFMFKEPLRTIQSKTAPPCFFLLRYKQLFKNGTFWRYVSLSPMLYCAEIMFYTVLPFYLSNTFHLTPKEVGYYISAIILSYAFGSLITPSLLDRLSHDQTIFLSLFLIIFSNFFQFLLAFTDHATLGTVLVFFALHEFGMAFLYAPTMSRAFHLFENSKGTASSVPNILFASAAALGAFMGGIVKDNTFVISAFCLFGASLTALTLFAYHILQSKQKFPQNMNTVFASKKIAS